ncbi:hypothetical protein EWM62_07870 [Mucilaginibacter terrigena]|uniref:Uncharacterized protein n=1 Tax=Mucilaginibacter terrigena TaxID=2492395 RepID=A0A4Q5LMU7_9SPHI|nr:hypothetical protein [Mucilaginibacter terrigena]RYU90563.1 hypothetical protein EWM62_07870 [Mucilaginibacter terrigena]
MMKRLSLVLLFLFAFSFVALCQSQLTVDKTPRQTSFNGYSKVITSLSQVPKNIKDSAEVALVSFLGDFSSKTRFENGQIVDLEAYHKFKANDNPGLFIPKYELIFVLRDPSIGIRSYPIELRLNEFGKLLKLNWPKKGYTNKSKFPPLDTVRNAVLNRAKKLNFNRSNYEIAFNYDFEAQKFYWTFLFLISKKNNVKRYNLLTINWANLNDIRQSEQSTVTVY